MVCLCFDGMRDGGSGYSSRSDLSVVQQTQDVDATITREETWSERFNSLEDRSSITVNRPHEDGQSSAFSPAYEPFQHCDLGEAHMSRPSG